MVRKGRGDSERAQMPGSRLSLGMLGPQLPQQERQLLLSPLPGTSAGVICLLEPATSFLPSGSREGKRPAESGPEAGCLCTAHEAARALTPICVSHVGGIRVSNGHLNPGHSEREELAFVLSKNRLYKWTCFGVQTRGVTTCPQMVKWVALVTSCQHPPQGTSSPHFHTAGESPKAGLAWH